MELYALCTRTPARLRELAERFRTPEMYTDYRQLLANPDIDAVCVVTMWDQHRAPALAALEAGKHVFIEKPLASTAADCDAIVLAAQAASGFCMVGHICRFNPRYAAAKREIDSGAIGKIGQDRADCRRRGARHGSDAVVHGSPRADRIRSNPVGSRTPLSRYRLDHVPL